MVDYYIMNKHLLISDYRSKHLNMYFCVYVPLWVDEEDLTLRAAIYSLLLRIHVDKADWKGALKLLDRAITDMSRTRHQLWANKIIQWSLGGRFERDWKDIWFISYFSLCFTRALLKHRILVKARRGESVTIDMQKLQDEGEQCCSLMWHQVALCAGNITQQLTCYQKSITSLLVLPHYHYPNLIHPHIHADRSYWNQLDNNQRILVMKIIVSFVHWAKGIFLASLYHHQMEPTCHYNCVPLVMACKTGGEPFNWG